MRKKFWKWKCKKCGAEFLSFPTRYPAFHLDGRCGGQGEYLGKAELTREEGQPTFGRWLRQQKHRQDSVGDLARDFIADGCAKRLSSFRSIARHIEECHDPCDAAIEALYRAYFEYRAKIKEVKDERNKRGEIDMGNR